VGNCLDRFGFALDRDELREWLHTMKKLLAAWCHGLPLLGGLVPLLAPGAAHAQLLSRYLPQSVPGYELDPIQAVMQNGGPDYNPVGWRVDDFVIRPAVDESFGYDQNPLGLNGGKSSVVVDSAASVNANSDWSRNSLGASFSINDLEYLNLPIANQRTDTAFVGGRLDIGRDSIDLSAGHIDSDLGPTDVFTEGLVAPVPYESNDIRAAYNWLLNRLTLTPNVDFNTYRFGTAQGSIAPVNDTSLDKDQIAGGVTGNYEVSPGRSIVVVWQETQADFLHRAPGSINPNYLDSLILAGLDYDTLALFRYDFLVGYERRSFGTSSISTLSVPVVEASVTYLPTRLSTIQLSAVRHLSDAGYNVAENLAYTEGVLRLDHALRRNILLNARVDAALTDASGNSLSHFQLTTGFGATWLLSRRIRVSGDYTFSHGSSSGNNDGQNINPNFVIFGDNVNNTYSSSAFTVSLHFQL
jgi:hypothetical protein